MYRSMYDILNKSINYGNEYEKLWNMVFTGTYYKCNSHSYSLLDIFDKIIVNWKYKGTKCSSKEVMEELELQEHPNIAIEEAILKLCDFIVNIRAFLIFEKEKIDKEAEEADEYNRYCPSGEEVIVPKRIYAKDKIMIDLVYELLNSLNYEIITKEEYQCFIIKKNTDAEETAKVVENEDISTKILQYNDYTIVNDKEAKRTILKHLADYFEQQKEEIKKYNTSLEKNISFALNNFNIRHNNIAGNNQNDFMRNITESETIKLYDKVYFLMLIAFRIAALKDFEKDIEDIRKNKFNK